MGGALAPYDCVAIASFAAAVLGVAVLIFAFTQSFAVLLASFLLWSVASALMSGADMALLFDTLRAAGREAQYERLAGRGMACAWSGGGCAIDAHRCL